LAEPLTAAPVDPSAAAAWLDGLYDAERTGRLGAPTLERISAVVAALGHPEAAYPVIHVTGTNGKGSTAAMTAALLRATGRRVGVYSSPHLENLAERVALDGRPVGTDDMWSAVAAVASAAERCGTRPTWFEAVTAAGLWFFRQARVDVAVVEVGMLGRWDATNVVHGAVAVVTNVALDHTDVAGPTRAHIAAEKAGIIEEGATLVLGETDPGLQAIFEAEHPGRILRLGAELRWERRRAVGFDGQVVDLHTPWGEHPGVRIASLGRHQCDNAALALGAAEALLAEALPESALDALSVPVIPGRLEVVSRSPTVLVDGAHNPAGAAALRSALEELDAVGTARRRWALVCGVLSGRDPEEYLREVGVGRFDTVVATEPPSPRALSAGDLAEAVSAAGGRFPAVIEADAVTALGRARAAVGPEGLVVVTGSLYLVGALRRPHPERNIYEH